jgi:hypothetical protein
MGSTRDARREGRSEAAQATMRTSRRTAASGKVGGGDTVEKAGEEARGSNCQGKAGEAAREADAQSLPEKSFNDLAA